MKKKKSHQHVVVRLDTLALLCLNVDYKTPSHTRDRLESLSIALAKRHGFDTHKFRLKYKHVEEKEDSEAALAELRLDRSRRSHCPFCDSWQIEGESVEINGGGATQVVSCLDCEKEWQDKYELESVEEYE